MKKFKVIYQDFNHPFVMKAFDYVFAFSIEGAREFAKKYFMKNIFSVEEVE